MSYGNALLLFLALVVATNTFLFFRRRRGRFLALVVLKNSKPKRTPGEIDRELWEQKGARDRAMAAYLSPDAKYDIGTRHIPTRHLPDPPCEVER